MAENYGVKLTIDTSQVNRGVSEYESAISKIVSATEKALPRLSFERVFNQISLGSPVIQRVAESIANLSASISNVNRSMEGLSGKFTRVATAVEKIAENAPFAGRGLERLSESIAKTDFTKIDGIAKEYAKAIRTISKETEKVLEKISFDPLKQSLESAQQTLVPLGGTVRDFAKAFTELRTAISGSGQSFDSIVKSFGKIASGSDGFIKAVTGISTAVGNLPTTRVEAVTQSFQNLTAWARAAQQAIRDTGAALKASELSGASLPKTPKAPTISKNLLDYEKVDKARKAIEDFGKSLIKSVIVSNEFVKNLEAISKGLVKAGTSFSYASREIGIYVIRARQAASLKSVVPTTSSASIRKVATETRAAAESTRRSTQTIGQAFDNMGLRITAAVAVGNASVQAFKALIQGVVIASRDIVNAVGFWERLTLSTQFYAAQARQAAGDTRQFEEVLNSVAGEAQVTIDWLQRLAVLSPFTAQQVATVYRVAQAYGLTQKAAQDLLPKLLDLAAAGGLDADVLQRIALALGQVEARGKLTGEEIRQLGNAGIPIRRLLVNALDIANSEFEDLVEQGFFTADKVIPLITESLEQFEGAAERVSTETISGLINALTEIRQISEAKLFGGLFEQIKPQLQELVLAFSSNELPNLLQAIGEEIGRAFAYIAGVIQEYVQVWVNWWNSLSETTRDSIIVFVLATATIVALGVSLSVLTAIVSSLIRPTTILAAALAGIVTWWTRGSTVLTEGQKSLIRIRVASERVARALANDTKRVETDVQLLTAYFKQAGEEASDSFNKMGESTEETSQSFEKTTGRVISSVSALTKKVSQETQSLAKNSDQLTQFTEKTAVNTSKSYRTLTQGLRRFSSDIDDNNKAVRSSFSRVSKDISGLTTGLVDQNKQIVTNFAQTEKSTGKTAQSIGDATSAITKGFSSVTQSVADTSEGIVEGTTTATKVVGKAATGIAGVLSKLTGDAAKFGADTMRVYADGLASGTSVLTRVISSIGSLIRGQMQPQSPPPFLSDIDEWGRETMQIYVDSFGDADFDVISDIAQTMQALLTRDVLEGESEVNIIERLIGTRREVSKAISEIARFGQATEETLSSVRNAAGSAGDELDAYLRAYARVSQTTRQEIELQDELNEVSTRYERILGGLNSQLNKLNEEQQQASEEQDLIALQRVVNTAGITDLKRSEAESKIKQILIQRQIRSVEQQQQTEEDAINARLTAAELERKAATDELSLLKERIGYQTDSYNLQLRYNQALEEFNRSLQTGSNEPVITLADQLKDALRSIQLQNEELRDNEALFRARQVLLDKNATAAEKAAAALVVQEVSLNRSIRDIEATELGISLEIIRQIQFTLGDIQGTVQGGLLEPVLTELEQSIIVIRLLGEELRDAQEKARVELILRDPDATQAERQQAILALWQIRANQQQRDLERERVGLSKDLFESYRNTSFTQEELGIQTNTQLDYLEKQRKVIQLQNEELRDNVELARQKKILEDESLPDADKIAAQLAIYEIGINRAQRDIEAAALDLNLSALRDLQPSALDPISLAEEAAGKLQEALLGLQIALDDARDKVSLFIDTLTTKFNELNDSLPSWLRVSGEDGDSPILTIFGYIAAFSLFATTVSAVSGSLNILKAVWSGGKWIAGLFGLGKVAAAAGGAAAGGAAAGGAAAAGTTGVAATIGATLTGLLAPAAIALAAATIGSLVYAGISSINQVEGDYNFTEKTKLKIAEILKLESEFWSRYDVLDNIRNGLQEFIQVEPRDGGIDTPSAPIADFSKLEEEYDQIIGTAQKSYVDALYAQLGADAQKSFSDSFEKELALVESKFPDVYKQFLTTQSQELGKESGAVFVKSYKDVVATGYNFKVDGFVAGAPAIQGPAPAPDDTEFDLGKSMMEGVSAGISSYDIAPTAEEFKKKTISAFKEVFEIASPSEVFSREVGVPIVEGIAEGIEDTNADSSIALFSQSFLKTISTLSLDVQTVFGEMYDDVSDNTGLWLDNLIDSVDQFIRDMIGTDTARIPSLSRQIIQVFSDMRISVRETMNSLKQDVLDVIDKLIVELNVEYSSADISNPAYQFGISFVDAIVAGISSQDVKLRTAVIALMNGTVPVIPTDTPPAGTVPPSTRSYRSSTTLPAVSMFSSMPSQIASSGIVTNNYIRNYNLTVTSARSTESIALDFNRMEMVSY